MTLTHGNEPLTFAIISVFVSMRKNFLCTIGVHCEFCSGVIVRLCQMGVEASFKMWVHPD